MKQKLLSLLYIFLLGVIATLGYISNDAIQTIKLTFFVFLIYFLYLITRSIKFEDDLKDYNFLYVSIAFVFAIYAAGFRSTMYLLIIYLLLIASFLGMFISFFYKEKKVQPKRRSKIITKNARKEETLSEILRDAKALEEAEKEIKQLSRKKKVVKKTSNKKKKVVKKATKKPVVKKLVKKKVVKKKTSNKKK
ncbi:MAG: hypothetical protein PHU51_01285 [Candidatus Nanoarchaeia archaeon]|nr:hypothetical protein [Candidatus Nanoarchaeia archaeon]